MISFSFFLIGSLMLLFFSVLLLFAGEHTSKLLLKKSSILVAVCILCFMPSFLDYGNYIVKILILSIFVLILSFASEVMIGIFTKNNK
jgi:hypothetical protein